MCESFVIGLVPWYRVGMEMPPQSPNVHLDSQPLPVHLQPAAEGNWDFTNGKDLATIHRQVRDRPRRWRGSSDELKDKLMRLADKGAGVADGLMDSPETAIVGVDLSHKLIRAVGMVEQQNQTDEWNHDKNERLDAGKATERVSLQPQITLRGLPDDDDGDSAGMLPVPENGDAGGNGDALPPITDG